MLMKTASQSLTEQLCARFAERIRNRLLAPGARLPSVRLCAEQQGVSVSTVVAAYDQLQAQGLVVARKNSGFFVRDGLSSMVGRGGASPANEASNTALRQEIRGPSAIESIAFDKKTPAASATTPLVDGPSSWSTASWIATRHAPVDATALIRGMFHTVSKKPQPGMGVFPSDWLDTTFMPTAVRKVTSAQSLRDFSLQYGEPKGDTGLRRALSQKLSALNVHAVPEQIITTVGATHALDIVSRTLLRHAV